MECLICTNSWWSKHTVSNLSQDCIHSDTTLLSASYSLTIEFKGGLKIVPNCNVTKKLYENFLQKLNKTVNALQTNFVG